MLKIENLPYFELQNELINTDQSKNFNLLNNYFKIVTKDQHPKSIAFLSKSLNFQLKNKLKFSARIYKFLSENFKLIYSLSFDFSFFKTNRTHKKHFYKNQKKKKIPSILKFKQLIKKRKKLTLKLKLKKKKKMFRQAEIIITKRLNNTFLTFIDKYSRKCLFIMSAGLCKFKNSKKRSPFTEETIAKNFIKKVSSFNYKIVDIVFKTKVIKSLQFLFKGLSDSKSFTLRFFIYKKPFPFGYVRHKKLRRI